MNKNDKNQNSNVKHLTTINTYGLASSVDTYYQNTFGETFPFLHSNFRILYEKKQEINRFCTQTLILNVCFNNQIPIFEETNLHFQLINTPNLHILVKQQLPNY